MRKYIYILFLFLTTSVFAESYYFCDFEDQEENELWQLNTPKNNNHSWAHLWYIGSADVLDGQGGLYISKDGGNTASYGAQSISIIAWREFDDLEQGEYDLAFDWKAVGDSLRACLRVALIPEENFSSMVCGMNDDIASRKWFVNNQLTFDESPILHNSSVWSHSVTKINIEEKKYRLVFMWITSGNAAIRNPGACIDNVQIARNNCGTPTDLHVSVDGSYATFTWKSTAESFNIRYTKQGDTVSHFIPDIRTPKLILPLEHGVYNVYIQVICNGEKSVWYDFPVVLVYSSKCFNYLDLQDSQCWYSPETASDWHANDTALKSGKIDHGFLSIQSRHTIHYNDDEFDPRTYNSYDSDGNPVEPLRTVPDGEIASVRIGSWEETARVVRVTYDFTVDTTEAAVLMLKYAMVLQSSGHAEPERPRFTLKIVDADTGEELSTCTTVDFSAKTRGDGWYNSPVHKGSEDARDVCWRDWTTVGLNLTDYNNTNVRIILTVYGCTAEVHYGYAYFTLNCAAGNIEGINCGDTPTNEFIAPDGFNYRWYLESDPNTTLSEKRIFPVAYDDDQKYKVDVIYKTNDQCGFTLSACAIPRYPVADAIYDVYQKDCKNYIRFNNNSHVKTVNLRTGEVIEFSEYPVESYYWDFHSLGVQSVEQNPELELPQEGGDFQVSLTVGVGLCDSTKVFNIHVPSIGPDSIIEQVQLCEGMYYEYKGKYITTDTVLVYDGINRYGCDSVHITNVQFVPTTMLAISDTIVQGESYLFAGQEYTQSGQYQHTYASSLGCDSIVILSLYVVDTLRVNVGYVESPCEDSPSFDVHFNYLSGFADSCRVSFASAEQSIGWRDSIWRIHMEDSVIALPVPATVRAGRYPFSLHFISAKQGSNTVESEVLVRYASSIIQQRWNDVLGILNEQYNGGYIFTSYQWYKNGEPIVGAISPYYYEEDNLDVNAEYSVELLREEDTMPIMTCAYMPVELSTNTEQKTIIKRIYEGKLYIIVGDQVYDCFGNKTSNVIPNKD